MTEQEKTTLTEEVLTLHEKVDGYGRKSVSLILKCGKKLTEIQNGLPKGKWMDWQMEHKDKISISTVRRYRKAYDYSLVNNVEGLTWNELLKKMNEKKTKPQSNETGETESGQQEQKSETNLQKVNSLVSQLLDIVTKSGTEELLEMMLALESIVHIYEDNVGLRKEAV